MIKIILNLLIFVILTGCSVTNQVTTENAIFGSKISAYLALKNKGIVRFNYATYGGTRYWMWFDLNKDDEGKQTFVATIYNSTGTELLTFRRPAVDILYHKNPDYNNLFILDLGTSYSDSDPNLLKRYIFIEKTGLDSFRGKMLDYISWNQETDFDIISTGSYPEGSKESIRYDNVKTRGKVVSPPLPYGKFNTFDELRKYDVLRINYLTKNRVKYWMWFDFRTGVDNEMQIVYHKLGGSSTLFISKRKIVNILMNINNPTEFIIDLGLTTEVIPRYIYVKSKSSTRFRGAISDNPQWGMDTSFEFDSSSIPSQSKTISSDYNNVQTQGSFDYFEPAHIGENPNSYDGALAEAIRQVHGVDSFVRTSASYTESGADSIIKTHRKEFYYQRRNGKIENLKFIHTVEYNGRDGSQLFGNYFGERYAVNVASVQKIEDNANYRISHKGYDYSIDSMKKKGYIWYSIFPQAKSEMLAITNTDVGGDNVWRSIPHRIGTTSRYREAFLVKKLNQNQFAIVDVFQQEVQDGYPSTLVVESGFDFDKPPAKYIYTKK